MARIVREDTPDIRVTFSEEAKADQGNAPAVDAVEVVRCKDCECWMYEYDDEGLCVTDVAPIDDGTDGVARLAMDFCSYGKRRVDDGK